MFLNTSFFRPENLRLPACAALAILLWLAGPSAAHAQSMFDSLPAGHSITGPYYPVNNESGVLVQEMRGSRATKASNARVEIADLDLRLYDNATGKLTTIMKMPLALFFVHEQKLSTTRGVLIQYPTREIRADSMEWFLKGKMGTLKKNVKVVLHDFDFGASNQQVSSDASPGDAAPPGRGGTGNTLPLPSVTLPADSSTSPGSTANQDTSSTQPQPVDWSSQPQGGVQPAQNSPQPAADQPKPGDIILPSSSTP